MMINNDNLTLLMNQGNSYLEAVELLAESNECDINHVDKILADEYCSAY